MRRNRLWAEIQPDVRMLATRDDIGRAISPAEEAKLLEACGQSRSRSLLPAVTLALNTCMRYSEIRLLQWHQVDFGARALTVGKAKSDAGTGRVLPVNARAWAVLEFWASNFPDRTPAHYVFPAERYGAAGEGFKACTYNTDPTKPIGRWKEAWEAARRRAASTADSMISGTRAARGCSKQVYRFLCSLCLWAGVRQPLSAWRSATVISGRRLLGVQWKRSPRPVPPTQKTRKTRQGPFDNPFDLNVDAGTNVPNV